MVRQHLGLRRFFAALAVERIGAGEARGLPGGPEGSRNLPRKSGEALRFHRTPKVLPHMRVSSS